MMARKRDPSKQNEKDTMKLIYKAPMQMIKGPPVFVSENREWKSRLM